MCEASPTMTSAPGREITAAAIWLDMVPDGVMIADSMPNASLSRASNVFVAVSSPSRSSAKCIPRSPSIIATVGWIAVSLRRSRMSDIDLLLTVLAGLTVRSRCVLLPEELIDDHRQCTIACHIAGRREAVLDREERE